MPLCVATLIQAPGRSILRLSLLAGGWPVALIWRALPRAPIGAGEAEEGNALPVVAVPSWLHPLIGSSAWEVSMGEQARVVIGMDPHKRSVTVEVMKADEQIVGHGRFGTDVAGFAQPRSAGVVGRV
jgi:hypothetical protein